jgi:hypothetical protein
VVAVELLRDLAGEVEVRASHGAGEAAEPTEVAPRAVVRHGGRLSLLFADLPLRPLEVELGHPDLGRSTRRWEPAAEEVQESRWRLGS